MIENNNKINTRERKEVNGYPPQLDDEIGQNWMAKRNKKGVRLIKRTVHHDASGKGFVFLQMGTGRRWGLMR